MRNTIQLRLLFLILIACSAASAAERKTPAYAKTVLADDPVIYWRLNEGEGSTVGNSATADNSFSGEPVGSVQLMQAGPRPEFLPDFEPGNAAAVFDGKGSFIRVRDTGAESVIDFDKGDSLTLEAWVNLKHIQNGQNVYIIGKGRTQNAGVRPHNQNYALRLRGQENTARISFVFRDAANPASGDEAHWHRWTSDVGFAEKSGWHHVAVSYTFGASGSVRGYIDGAEVKGRWDMGGPSDAAPVVDDDEIWIGSSMGGSPLSSFNGSIDEVAIYRSIVSPERMKLRYRANTGVSRFGDPDGSNDDGQANAKIESADVIPSVEPKTLIAPPVDLPKDAVRVEILEGFAKIDSEAIPNAKITATYLEPAFAFVTFPKKYDAKGLITDRSNPFLLRATASIELPPGEHKLMLRARNMTRLLMDGTVLTSTPQPKGDASGHGKVPPPAVPLFPNARLLKPGHNEKIVTIKGDGKPHVLSLEIFVGGGKLRPEVGELSLSIAKAGSDVYTLVSPKLNVPLTDDAFDAFAQEQRKSHALADAQNRRAAGAKEAEYWAMRHELARKLATPMSIPKDYVDLLINAPLAGKNINPAPQADDWAFLRRVTLDTTGLVPTPEQIQRFVTNSSPTKRAELIDSLLNDPAWADHWVSYWQDVLAENPGLLKPELNNTGPFRFWIHESLADNKPMDRFATELIMMEGSKFGGGPAGFAMASQNDLPMAEKAHIVGKAFLAFEMKCARCHDAPSHAFVQKDLFNVAAMLKKTALDVPKTSSIPRSEAELKELAVTVSLKPGTTVQPVWPFEKLLPAVGSAKDLPPGVLRQPNDSREQLAALVTSPKNERFAQVLVNRVWKRLMGWGIVEPVDDWETAKPSHPELLKYLAHELVTHGYDLKHVAKVILNSQAYQRAAIDPGEAATRHAPARRRMTAEQIVDSLFAASGKKLGTEELTFDVDGRQNIDAFLNFGVPRRAWEFSSLSNERDRPALSLPVAQTITDVLTRFGWRESRQAPITDRENAVTVLQPAILANGIVANRIARLSDDSALTELALKEQPLDVLIAQVFQRILCRPPSATEAKTFTDLLKEGYATRIVKDAALTKKGIVAGGRIVSWSNHLSPEATQIKMELEKAAREGEPVTQRLNAPWRERMEDMIWTLINSPEFLFVP
ncbi:MAG TPA: DUF1553 domain-containing protein [Planctomycetota bacterium]|nr:DUF1553 domain-containing protein [Planctomycetota bacterium]